MINGGNDRRRRSCNVCADRSDLGQLTAINHRCVGARVAELQLTVLLEEMGKRRLRVNVLAEPERVPACFVHGYKHMQVSLERY